MYLKESGPSLSVQHTTNRDKQCLKCCVKIRHCKTQ